MPQTKLETELRLVARERIARGQLPCGATSRMWGGHGSDLPCALCDKPIQPDEVEYEVELRESGACTQFASISSVNRCGRLNASARTI